MLKTIITLVVVFITLIIAFFYWLTHRYTIIDKTKSENYYYSFFKNEIHYIPMGNWFELGDRTLKDIDVNNFTILSAHHIKDKNSIFYQGYKITQADIKTFTVLLLDNYNPKFAKDKNNLYYGANTFENIDLKSYKIEYINNSYVVSDNYNKYSLIHTDDTNFGKPSSVKPLPKNYVALTSSYGKDDNFLYYQEKAIEGSSGNKFRQLPSFGSEIIATESGMYYDGYKVFNIDSETLTVIDSSYCFKDKNGIYCGLDYIKGEVNYDKSYNLLGYAAIKLNIDTTTFKLIDGPVNFNNEHGIRYYAKDKHGIYCIYPFVKMKGVDISTFQIMQDQDGRYAKDKNHNYLDGEIYTGKIWHQ